MPNTRRVCGGFRRSSRRSRRTCACTRRSPGRRLRILSPETEARRHAEDAIVEPIVRLVVVRVDSEKAVRVAGLDQPASELDAESADEPEVHRLDLVVDVAAAFLSLELRGAASRQPERRRAAA